MFNHNFLKEKLESGKTVLGTWCILPSPALTDVICSAGLDFIIIDAEHGPINFETAQQMVSVCESRSVSPIMRLGGIHESDILRALDIGIHGVQIPNVTNKAEAEKVVEYSKYPPIGERGYSPFTKAGDYSLIKAKELTEIANLNTLIGINIEGKEAFENIDEILTIKGIDIIFVGLFDISKSLGIPGQVDNPIVQKKLNILVDKINQSGKYPGTIATNLKNLESYKKLGIKYLLYLVDCNVIQNAYRAPVQIINNK